METIDSLIQRNAKEALEIVKRHNGELYLVDDWSEDYILQRNDVPYVKRRLADGSVTWSAILAVSAKGDSLEFMAYDVALELGEVDLITDKEFVDYTQNEVYVAIGRYSSINN